MNNQGLNNKANSSMLTDTSIINEQFIIETIIENSKDTFYFKDKNSRFLFISKIIVSRHEIEEEK